MASYSELKNEHSNGWETFLLIHDKMVPILSNFKELFNKQHN